MQKKLSMLWKAFLTGALMLIANVAGYAQVENAPNLLIPANGYACVNMKHTFIWQEETFAQYYVLKIAKDAAFEDIFLEEQVGTYKKEVTFPEELRNTKFYWKVYVQFDRQVLNPQGQPKLDSSVVWSFSTVYPVAAPTFPILNDRRYQTDITFKWNKPVGTQDFRIQVSDDINFSEDKIVLNEVVKDPYTEEDKEGEFQWKAPKNFHTYYWRIRSEKRDDNCGSEWSGTYVFKTAAKAPKNVSPESNTVGLDRSVKFVWSYGKEKQDGYVLRYSTSPKFEEANTTLVPGANGVITDANYTAQGLEINTKYYWQVAAMVDGSISDWSEAYNFTIQYNRTTVISPKEDASCIPLTAELKWNEKDAARGYSVEIRTTAQDDPKDDNLVQRMDYIKDTKVEVKLPDGLTKYFWRVKLKDENNEGPWSDFASFITTYAAPRIVSPMNGDAGIPVKANFSWESPYDNVEYMIEIAKLKDTLGTTVYNIIHRDTVNKAENSNLNEYSYTLPEYYGNYAWRVAAINNSNCNGEYSAFAQFTTELGATTLIAPANESIKLDTIVEFKWEAVKYATNYEIQIAYANDSTDKFHNMHLAKTLLGIEGNKVQIPGLKYEQDYIWRIRAYNPKSSGEWSEVFAFRTSLSPAGKPELVFPENKATKVEFKPTYTWKAAHKAVKYELIVAQDPMFEEVIVKQVIDNIYRMDTATTDIFRYDTTWVNKDNNEIERIDTVFVRTDTTITKVYFDTLTFDSPELRVFQEYYWKVAAYNVENSETWSDTWQFRTMATKFEKAPNLIFPENQATNVEMDVKFEWQRLTAAERYHIQVSRTADFENVEMEDENVTFNIRTLHMKDFGTSYFWRVRAINEAGEGPWSAPFTFKTAGTSSVEDGIVKFNVYPNPTFNVLRVSYNSAVAQDAVLYIVDASGKVVLTKSQALSENANSIELSVRHLVQGNYFLTIKANGEENTIRFTVIK